MSRKITDKILKLRDKAEELEGQAEFTQQQADAARAEYEKAYNESERLYKLAQDLWEKYMDCDDVEQSSKLYVDHLVAETNAEVLEKSLDRYEKDADKLDDKAQDLKFKAMDLRYEIESLKRERDEERAKKQREKESADFNAFMERENERMRQRAFGDNFINANNVSISMQFTPKPAEPVKPVEPPERKHLPIFAFDFKKKSADKPKPYDGNFSDVDAGLSALYNSEKSGYEESSYRFRESYGKKTHRDKYDDVDDDFDDDGDKGGDGD